MLNRRQTLGSLLTGTVALAAPTAPAAAHRTGKADSASPGQTTSDSGNEWAWMKWPRGIEGQRKADLGNGTFLNPIVSGDHPDPSILKEGRDYFLTFSSFDAYPGLVIWHSRDLVNWQPLNAALRTPIGSVWAPDLSKYKGRYYLYIPARTPGRNSIYVITAEDVRGPWSEPVDLNLPGHIDPNHVVGEDGTRYLALSGGDLVELAEDGLATAGAPKHIYDPWRYPESWVVESFSPEGPKILRHGDYLYMLTAVGGTAGPPTGHMVTVARARSVHGPWENAPNNPVVRTTSATQKWWSRGHASAVEGPDGSWWLVYHGYENGFWTLGRQTLLAPMEWTKDGWIKTKGGDLSRPIKKPKGGQAVPHGMALSDDFSTDRFGSLWSFYDPGPTEMERARFASDGLHVRGKGSQPFDCSPISFRAGDPSYEVETEIEISGGAQAGLLLFYNRRLYCGLGFDAGKFVMHRQGLERAQPKPADVGNRLFLHIANDRHIVTIRYSPDGKSWSKFGVQMEVSGYHHNTAYDFLSLRPAIYVAGPGEARFSAVNYRAL